MTTTTTVRAGAECPGCGVAFRGSLGLLAHQHSRFAAMACKPTTRTTRSTP